MKRGRSIFSSITQCPKSRKVFLTGHPLSSLPRWLLLVLGFFALIWFLIRVLPKPSRISYPCQLACVPLAAFFFIWFSAVFASVLSQKKSRSTWKKVYSGFALACAFMAISLAQSSPSSVNEAPLDLSIAPRESRKTPSSEIFVVTGTTGADSGFESLVALMEKHNTPFYATQDNPDGTIAKDDVVIIKINCQWDQRGGTNVDLVASIIRAIVSHPDGFTGEIVVADNGQAQFGSAGSGGSMSWTLNNAIDTTMSMSAMAESFSGDYRVSTFLWDRITLNRVSEYSEGDMSDGFIVHDEVADSTGIVVSYPKFQTEYGTMISFKHGIWLEEQQRYDSNRLKVLNVPVLKSHSIYGVTAAVKHYMGIPSDRLTNRNPHNSVGTGGMGTLMVETRLPDLNIIDAIWINPIPGRGPRTSYRDGSLVKTIAASTDPVALDYWASKEILTQAAEELGYRDYFRFDPDDRTVRSFGTWLELSMQELDRAGIFSTMDYEEISVFSSSVE